ncbi:uncharacterized protein LOC130723363 [Lotus japonicus]|uniref:uncharacterized protein LOC130723363 n=1 Tax=Lotus japonicus TaxID=34305 RepID=UPI00258D1794|nr:uncharacterized protein LOC130723363 [Lotus japonicus]
MRETKRCEPHLLLFTNSLSFFLSLTPFSPQIHTPNKDSFFPFSLSHCTFLLLHCFHHPIFLHPATTTNNHHHNTMSNKSPVFPMPDPQHFSDYGFDPQINYFQVLEEAMKHKHETARSIDSIHFKLQKPISNDDSNRTKLHNSNKKKRWWRTALLFFKWRRTTHHHHHHDSDVHQARARAFRATVSGPVYLTESRSGSTTPCRTTSRPSSGPLAGTLMPPVKGAVDMPYLSLRELTFEQQQQQKVSPSAMPIYLVT